MAAKLNKEPTVYSSGVVKGLTMMSFCSNKDARHFCAGTHSVCALTSIQQESNRQNFHDTRSLYGFVSLVWL